MGPRLPDLYWPLPQYQQDSNPRLDAKDTLRATPSVTYIRVSLRTRPPLTPFLPLYYPLWASRAPVCQTPT